jgi:hypothetical protein
VGLTAALLLLFVWLSGAVYNHFVRFPAEQKEWEQIRASRQALSADPEWQEFRGIIHSHSELSHDCEVTFEEILGVLKANDLDFICMSDHCKDGAADFDAQWRGVRDGKLFVPGFEMKNGFMPFGARSGTVLSNSTDPAVLARQIVESGGILFYAHPEEPRDWERPELSGMEIYNTHTDFKRIGLRGILPDLLINQRSYPDQVFHSISRRPSEFLKRWDLLNQSRKIVGIAGNDCHQNTGARAFCSTNGTLVIEDTSPKVLAEYRLNSVTRAFAAMCFGPLEPGRRLFHIQLDPYDRMSRLVNTHLLARELSEPAILDALRKGRGFVGFNMIADSSGFQWLATNSVTRAVMGEQIDFTSDIMLRAASPHACRFTVVKDGIPVHSEEARRFEWRPPGPGKYRVEADLNIRNRWVPWVYTNPIELR